MMTRMAILLCIFLSTATLVSSQGKKARNRFQFRDRYPYVPVYSNLNADRRTQYTERTSRNAVDPSRPLSFSVVSRFFRMVFWPESIVVFSSIRDPLPVLPVLLPPGVRETEMLDLVIQRAR